MKLIKYVEWLIAAMAIVCCGLAVVNCLLAVAMIVEFW